MGTSMSTPHLDVILNPIAGRGRAQRAVEHVLAELKRQQISHTLRVTEYPGHATSIAKEAMLGGSRVVVAIGGDGTVKEIAEGLLGSRTSLGVLSYGSGNDFAKLLDMPENLPDRLRLFVRGNSTQFDVGHVRLRSAPGVGFEKKSIFVNQLGIGFDARVAYESSKIRWLKDRPLYAYAVLKTLIRYRSAHYMVRIDDRNCDGRYYMVTVGNGVAEGGGFFTTPDARPHDGLFDICIIKNVGKIRIVSILPSVLRGTHTRNRHVHMDQCKRIHVEAAGAFTVHADGEILGTEVTQIDVQIKEGALKIINGRERID